MSKENGHYAVPLSPLPGGQRNGHVRNICYVFSVCFVYKKQASNNASSECYFASLAIHVESLSLPNICYVSNMCLGIWMCRLVSENAAHKYEVVRVCVAYWGQKKIANALNRPQKTHIYRNIRFFPTPAPNYFLFNKDVSLAHLFIQHERTLAAHSSSVSGIRWDDGAYIDDVDDRYECLLA